MGRHSPGAIVVSPVAWGMGFSEKMNVPDWPQDRNLAWIERQLFATNRDDQRKILLRRLLEELESFVPNPEHCSIVEQLVIQARARVDSQREKISELKSKKKDTAQAIFLLATMIATLALYVDRYRILQVVSRMVSRTSAKLRI
jgi:hypothetical protein